MTRCCAPVRCQSQDCRRRPAGYRHIYNTDGWQSETTDPYYNASPVFDPPWCRRRSGRSLGDGYSYDQAGRQVTETAYALGTQEWQTTKVYGGNFVTTVLPRAARLPPRSPTLAAG